MKLYDLMQKKNMLQTSPEERCNLLHSFYALAEWLLNIASSSSIKNE